MGNFVDASELKTFAQELDSMGPRATVGIDKVLDSIVPEVAQDAAATAPKDRPWLSVVGLGIQFDRSGLSRRIWSPLDPEGNNVALHVEYGTSKMPPRPFLVPALQRGGMALLAGASDVVERVLNTRG